MKNISLEINTSDPVSPKAANIILGGDLTVKGVTALKSKFVEIKDQFDKVDITVRDVTNLDLSVIQLLLSFRKTFKALDKDLKIEFNLAEEFNDLVAKGGFEELLCGNKNLAE